MWWMVLLVANAVVVALQTRPQLMGKAPKEEAPDDPLELVETGLAVVYAGGLSEDTRDGLAALPLEVPQ